MFKVYDDLPWFIIVDWCLSTIFAKAPHWLQMLEVLPGWMLLLVILQKTAPPRRGN